jgi:hypothetical protein
MQRTLASIALFVLASFCAACGGGDNSNNANTSGQLPRTTDRITVEYPNLFLQGGEAAQGKVTCELEEIPGVVLPYETTNGNTNRAVDTPEVHIRPRDAERYDTYVEVKLLPEGLDKVNPPDSTQLYAGDKKLVWEWSLKSVEGKKEGDEVSFHFQVNVTRHPKAGDAPDEEIRDIWHRVFTVKVGPPASRVKAALYGSPLFAAAGFVTFGTSLRRRKLLPASGEDDEGEAVGGDYERSMGVGGTSIDVLPGGSRVAAAVGRADIEEEVEEDVSATVYAPGQAAPGDAFLVQVFVHLPEQAASLEEIAREADEDAKRRAAARLQKKIRRGTELAFYLVIPGLDVDEPAQSCVWEGEPACVQFGVTVPEGCKLGSIIGTVTVSENSVPVGHLKFKFKVASDAAASAAQAPVAEPEPAGSLVRYRQAFISYASEDRSEVLKRVQMLNLAKIKFFQDLLTLEPGDSWERLLYEYIDKSDVFFLFWSRAASESEWVRREVEYAIKAKTDEREAGPEIIPVIIEGPPPARPPAELSFLHFNDKLLYFINSRETEV